MVFCALHDQLASLGRYAPLTRCFSAVAELLVLNCDCDWWQVSHFWSEARNWSVNNANVVTFTSVFISPSYCCTVWSAIGIITSSACPSVCNAVHCKLLSGSEYRAKSYTSVFLAGMFLPICPFRHFCCSMYLLAIKRTEKTSRRKRECECFETIRRALVVLRSVIYWLTELWSSTLNGHAWLDGSLDAFINSARWIGSCVPAVR